MDNIIAILEFIYKWLHILFDVALVVLIVCGIGYVLNGLWKQIKSIFKKKGEQ